MSLVLVLSSLVFTLTPRSLYFGSGEGDLRRRRRREEGEAEGEEEAK